MEGVSKGMIRVAVAEGLPLSVGIGVTKKLASGRGFLGVGGRVSESSEGKKKMNELP